MTILLPIACDSCVHLRTTDLMGHRKCDAFPEEVPIIIRDGSNDHTAPVEGDQGIQYKLRPSRQLEKDLYEKRRKAGV